MRLAMVFARNDLRANAALLAFFACFGIAGPAVAGRCGLIGSTAAVWILIAFGVTSVPVMAAFWCVGAEKMLGTMRVLGALAVDRTAIVRAKHLEAAAISAAYIAAGAFVFGLAGVAPWSDVAVLYAVGLPVAITCGVVATGVHFALAPQPALVACLVTALLGAWPVGAVLVERYASNPLATTAAVVAAGIILSAAAVALSSFVWGNRDDLCR